MEICSNERRRKSIDNGEIEYKIRVSVVLNREVGDEEDRNQIKQKKKFKCC